MHKLVIIRHGESEWNEKNLFTGWHDVDLTPTGRDEVGNAGEVLRTDRLEFDVVFTSVLKRAIETAWIILKEMDLLWIPVRKTWRLNERHYGELEGLSKTEQARKYGEDQVHRWRRSYDVRPPQLSPGDARHPRYNPRYRDVNPNELPTGESLKDVVQRFVPYWEQEIVPQLQQGKRVLVVAHGNSLRALVKHLEQISDADIVKMNLPTGMPRIYELDENLKPISSRFAASDDEVNRRIKEVLHQGKAK